MRGRAVAISVVCAERGPEGLPLDVKDTTMERRGVDRNERSPHTLEITCPQRGPPSAREVHRCICEIELGRPAKALAASRYRPPANAAAALPANRLDSC